MSINPMIITSAVGLASKVLDKVKEAPTVAPRETFGMPAGIQLAAAVVPGCIGALASIWKAEDDRTAKIHADYEEHMMEVLRETPDGEGGAAKAAVCGMMANRLGETKNQTMSDRLNSSLATKTLIGAVAAGGLAVAYAANSQAHAEQMSRQSRRSFGGFFSF